jgi:monofunctional biosynthetic peptidoglycan transglycosylase
MASARKKPAAWKRVIRTAVVAGVVIIALDFWWLAAHWPDWKKIAHGPVPKSQFIIDWEREHGRKAHWTPVPMDEIPERVVRAVLIAEDSNFFGHHGFDREALIAAWEKNLARKRVVFGGSTVSQQTAKNLFLSPSRTPWRKWHEIVLTTAMERNLTKRRILEIYLNDAELGDGIYGFEAGALEYDGMRIADLSQQQAIELAAALSGPKDHNPKTRSKHFLARVDTITHWLSLAGELETPAPSGG